MDEQDKRRNAILDAGLEVLIEQGWAATSMIKIARKANASKETLYNWFGDKDGFFAAVIRRNALPLDATLDPESTAPVAEDLERYGQALLTLLTSDKSVAINRAAMAEAGAKATLGPILVEAGRGKSLQVFGDYLSARTARGDLQIDSIAQAADIFVSLLKGDLQLFRLLGATEVPKAHEIQARAARASQIFVQIHAPAATS